MQKFSWTLLFLDIKSSTDFFLLKEFNGLSVW